MSSTDGVTHFFGTRGAPRDLVPAKHIGTVTSALPLYPLVVSAKQVHGTEVVVLDRPLKAGIPLPKDGDALISDQPNVLLTVRTADCVPLLLYDPQCRVIATVHAGWRGAIGGIVPKTLSVMQERFGCHARDIRVAIGPSARICCYEVGEEVICSLKTVFRDWPSVVEPVNAKKGKLNFQGLVQSQALHAGVLEQAVHHVGLCTICRTDLFYSYRREGSTNGTMVSGIMLTEKAT